MADLWSFGKMKSGVFILAATCLIQSAGLLWFWRKAQRLEEGPGSYRTLQMKKGEAVVIRGSAGGIEASLVDDDEPTVDFEIQKNGIRTLIRGYSFNDRIELSYWRIPMSASQRDSSQLMRDKDGDCIPETKLEKAGGRSRMFRLKSVEWEIEEPNQVPEPTSGSVTPRADARAAPSPPVAHR